MRSPPAAQWGLMSCSTLFGTGLERTSPDVMAAGTAIAVDQVCWYGTVIPWDLRLALPSPSAAASGTRLVCTFSAPSDFSEERPRTNGVPTQNQVSAQRGLSRPLISMTKSCEQTLLVSPIYIM
ncbi:hypothetical protein CIB84_008831 [Bambusicola thoracicus]|uniref:Uncharacterized protein n=1 Tax=Bambusicola thoracicus TaxID=9083 RepID=A0A2P4STH4_BAMTH|nr:hypothetical protein CIB84_008831 [Bambusicola thoracicus]